MRLQSKNRGMRAFIIALCVCLIVPLGAAAFAGSQNPSPVYVNLKAGLDAPEPLNAYAFELLPAADNPEGDPVAETVSILSRADGTIPVLRNLVYAAPGTYRYILQQKSLPLAGVMFDSNVFTLEVTVSVANGRLEARLTAADGTGASVDASSIRFTNTYDPGAASVILGGEQVLDGALSQGNAFAYDLEAVTPGAPLPAALSSGCSPSGTFRFGAAVFTEPGEYAYEIRQSQSGTLPEDPSVYTVSVSVKPAAAGALVASPSVSSGAGNVAATPVFRNAVSVPEPGISLSQALNDGEFTTEPVEAQGGDSLSYRLEASNPSESPALGVAVSLPIPEGLSLDAASLPAGTTYENGILVWSVGELDGGATKEIRVNAAVPERDEAAVWTTAATLDFASNSGTARSAGASGSVDSNALEVGVAGRKVLQGLPEGAVVSSLETTPQLTISMEQCLNDGFYSSDLMHTAAGDIGTYRITITNSSAAAALNVNVTDTIPSGLTLVTNSITDGGLVTDGVVTWNLGTIEAGMSRSVSFQVQFPAAPQFTTWTNTAMFNYQGHGYESSNSVSSDQTPGVIPTNTPTPTITPTPTPTLTPTPTPIPTATPTPAPVVAGAQQTPPSGPSPHTNDAAPLAMWIILAIATGAIALLSARRLRKARGN